MARTLKELVSVVRNRLQAPGPDGGGYTDTFIRDALYAAVVNIAEVVPVDTKITFHTVHDTNEYSIATVCAAVTLNTIYKVKYNDDAWLEYVPRNDFFKLTNVTEGEVNGWTLWGDKLILIGEVTATNLHVDLFISCTPDKMDAETDSHGLPVYAEEALVHYAVSQCYQITRDYDRATFHFNIFQAEKNLVARRSATLQAESLSTVSDSYWGPHTSDKVTSPVVL